MKNALLKFLFWSLSILHFFSFYLIIQYSYDITRLLDFRHPSKSIYIYRIFLFITPLVILVIDRGLRSKLLRAKIGCYTLLILSHCTWTENVPLIRFYGESTEHTHWPLVTFWRVKVQVSKSSLCRNSRRERLLQSSLNWDFIVSFFGMQTSFGR